MDLEDKGGATAELRAFDILFSDLVERIMSLSDRPDRCVAYIAGELRGIVGVRSVFVYECPQLTGEARPRLVSCLPERRRSLGEDPRLLELVELTHGHEEVCFFRPGEGPREGEILAELGIGDSLALPLLYGTNRVGVILLLDLLDQRNVPSILETLGRLSSILALILKNAWLYENLEAAVAERTAELERKGRELSASLAEKEVMLKEIHHRVKNNLQIVNSLLYLRMNGLPPETQRLFAESQSRVYAMALVHEEIYRSSDLASVNMADYIPRLTGSLLALGPDGIEVTYDLGSVGLSIDAAIPCGLILNELLINAFKYAFSGRSEGRLDIRCGSSDAEVVLEVADDGPGLPPDEGRAGEDKLGFTIIHGLSDQLHGRFEILGGPGARFRLSFRPQGIDERRISP